MNTPDDHECSEAEDWVIEPNPGPYGKTVFQIQPIRIATLNIRGARMDKIDRVVDLMLRYHIQIMVVTEAKRWSGDLDARIRMAGLEVDTNVIKIDSDRGGVALMWNPTQVNMHVRSKLDNTAMTAEA